MNKINSSYENKDFSCENKEVSSLTTNDETSDVKYNTLNLADFVYQGKLGLSTFVNDQLVIYHRMALRRALPSVLDGLKESQRKVLFTILERNYKKTNDLEKIMGAVKEETKYHHGGSSVTETITKMAQGYVGSNNIPLLENDGEFGCVDPDTEILLWDGSIKLAKDISINDILIGDDGSSRTIRKIVKGVDDMYHIKQGYGKDYVVNSQHILTLCYSDHKIIKEKSNMWIAYYYNKVSQKVTSKVSCFSRLENFNTSKISSTDAKKNIEDFLKNIPDEWNIFDINIQDYLYFPSYVKEKCKSVKNKTSVKWDKKDVPIDPYIFGSWLGVGNHLCRRSISGLDEITEGVLPATVDKICIEAIRCENKYIPKEYIINDEETRLKLLAGFIDTNGTIRNKKGVCYISISLEKEIYGHIIDSIQYISRSLGYKAEIEDRKNENCITIREMNITGSYLDKIPTKISRKKLEGGNENKDYISCSISAIKINKGKYIGWCIDRNERFLLGDFTVTHNSRILGGGDHAAPRYIATMAEKITRTIFSIQDDALLERMIEDNEPIEYRFYIPILPMILVNGVKGIASGYSTEIPSYNPLEIVNWLEMWLDGKHLDLPGLIPWYRGYTGDIKLEKFEDGRATGWRSKGILEKGVGKEKDWWHIKELPIGSWTKSFEEWLEYLESGLPPKDKKWKKKDVRCLSDIKSYSTPNKVHFMIKPTKDFIPDMNVVGNLKIMQSTKSLNNMVAIDENDYPIRFGSPEEILLFFCPMRLKYYRLRKNLLLKVLKKDLLISSNRYKFVKGVVDKKLDLHQSDEELEIMLSSNIWLFNKVISGQNKELSYDYLLSMQMRSMTITKLEELKLEADKLSEDIKILDSKTVKDIWKNDLNKFKTKYIKFLKTRCEE
jgi:hypothetical protein